MFSSAQMCSSKGQILLVGTLYFYAIYYNLCEACPVQCICEWTGRVNCQEQVLSEIPTDLPPNTNILLLGSNFIESVNEEYFQNMQNVLEIRLERNMIQELQPNTFMPLSSLVDLDLRYNKIENVPNEVFTGLEKLNRLNLRGNPITTIQQQVFRPLYNLQFLDLYETKLHQIPDGLFRGLKALQHLDLGNSKLISEFSPNVLRGLGNLTYLNLGENPNLSTLSRGMFFQVPSLKTLDLKGCDFRVLTSGMFDGLNNLEVLHLQNNGLRETLPLHIFENIPNLATLRVDNNDLTSLHESVISSLKESNGKVYVQNNKWQCSCGLMNIRARWPKVSPAFFDSGISCTTPNIWKGLDLWAIPLHDLQAYCLKELFNVKDMNLPIDSRVKLQLDCPISRAESSVLDWITPEGNYISYSTISPDQRYRLLDNGTLQVTQADSGSYMCSVTRASGESTRVAYRVTFSHGLFGSPTDPEDSDHESNIKAFLLPAAVIVAAVPIIAVIVAWLRCRKAKKADDKPYDSPFDHHFPVRNADEAYAYAFVSVPEGNAKKKRDISAYAINALFDFKIPDKINTERPNFGYDKVKGQRPKSHSCRERGSKYPAPVPVPRPSYTLGSRATSRAESCAYVTPTNNGGMGMFMPGRVDPDMSIPVHGGADMIEEDPGFKRFRQLHFKSVNETKRPKSNPYLELIG